ncbi:hypothetical protein B0H14DRAFT_3143160 [Mycena olivaceomarginata]|nr:hypothetical protein B0H14DRAFT_3143160 [Mycena olivaceomarginata]
MSGSVQAEQPTPLNEIIVINRFSYATNAAGQSKLGEAVQTSNIRAIKICSAGCTHIWFCGDGILNIVGPCLIRGQGSLTEVIVGLCPLTTGSMSGIKYYSRIPVQFGGSIGAEVYGPIALGASTSHVIDNSEYRGTPVRFRNVQKNVPPDQQCPIDSDRLTAVGQCAELKAELIEVWLFRESSSAIAQYSATIGISTRVQSNSNWTSRCLVRPFPSARECRTRSAAPHWELNVAACLALRDLLYANGGLALACLTPAPAVPAPAYLSCLVTSPRLSTRTRGAARGPEEILLVLRRRGSDNFPGRRTLSAHRTANSSPATYHDLPAVLYRFACRIAVGTSPDCQPAPAYYLTVLRSLMRKQDPRLCAVLDRATHSIRDPHFIVLAYALDIRIAEYDNVPGGADTAYRPHCDATSIQPSPSRALGPTDGRDRRTSTPRAGLHPNMHVSHSVGREDRPAASDSTSRRIPWRSRALRTNPNSGHTDSLACHAMGDDIDAESWNISGSSSFNRVGPPPRASLRLRRPSTNPPKRSKHMAGGVTLGRRRQAVSPAVSVALAIGEGGTQWRAEGGHGASADDLALQALGEVGSRVSRVDAPWSRLDRREDSVLAVASDIPSAPGPAYRRRLLGEKKGDTGRCAHLASTSRVDTLERKGPEGWASPVAVEWEEGDVSARARARTGWSLRILPPPPTATPSSCWRLYFPASSPLRLPLLALQRRTGSENRVRERAGRWVNRWRSDLDVSGSSRPDRPYYRCAVPPMLLALERYAGPVPLAARLYIHLRRRLHRPLRRMTLHASSGGPCTPHAVLWTRMLASDTPSAPRYVQPADAHLHPWSPTSASSCCSSLASHAQTPQHPPPRAPRAAIPVNTRHTAAADAVSPHRERYTSRAGQRWGLSSRCKSSRRTGEIGEQAHSFHRLGRSHTDRDVAYARPAAPPVPPAREHDTPPSAAISLRVHHPPSMTRAQLTLMSLGGLPPRLIPCPWPPPAADAVLLHHDVPDGNGAGRGGGHYVLSVWV